MPDGNEIKKTGRVDITVNDATGLRDIYKQRVGWKSEDLGMGDCEDYSTAVPGTNEVVGGICYSHKGAAELNVGWPGYITLKDIMARVVACNADGGEIAAAPRELSGGQSCVTENQSGATATLCQP